MVIKPKEITFSLGFFDVFKKFIIRYRSYRFIIVLDDMGVGISNLDRIFLTEVNMY